MASFWTGKRVLVTRGARFLGSFVVDALIRRGGPAPIVPRSRGGDTSRAVAPTPLGHGVRQTIAWHEKRRR